MRKDAREMIEREPSGVLFERDQIYPGAGGLRVTVLAVDGERVAAVGDQDELRTRFPRFSRIPLNGHTVLPACTDSHIHLAGFGFSLGHVDLRTSRSLQDAIARVARASGSATAGRTRICGPKFGFPAGAVWTR